MRAWPEMHWSEGQFLRPHHFQAAARQMETARTALLHALEPYSWGVLSLDLAQDAVANAVLEIRTAELILRDGTLVRIPENCTFDAREFKAIFDKSAGPLDVYFGVPEWQAVRSNVRQAGDPIEGRVPRYSLDLIERYDENTGENPQSIEVRRLHGTVFFGNEERTGFACVRIGQLERTAIGPSLIKNVIPPLLRIRAWAPLRAAIDVLWNDIRARCEQLGADAAQRALTYATGSPGDVEQLVKLGALNELTTRFGVFTGAPDLHPFQLYAALCEGIGRIALWDDLRRPRELPAYDHDDCGPVFEELIRYLRALVNGMLPRDYIERPFETREGGFGVDLDHEWFTPNHELYLGIRGGSSVDEILALFRTINFKLASPRDAQEVYRRRLPGLDFKSAGAVANLPKTAEQSYFRIARTPPYWEHCETERGIFIAMPPADMPKLGNLKLSLFVVKIR